MRLEARGYDSSLARVPVTGVRFAISDTTIATIDRHGLLTARKPGSAEIVATLDSLTDVGYVIVLAPVATVELIPPAEPHVARSQFTLRNVLRTATGDIVGRPGHIWRTSNPSIATVSEQGVITAKSPGTASITLEVEGQSGSADVEVISLSYLSVGSGDSDFCGLNYDGRAFCWGLVEGQLGAGGIADSVPLAVVGGHRFASVSAGGWHNCALDASGEAWCWGAAPIAVNTSLRFGRIQATAGPYYPQATCALTSGGALYCWGGNAEGTFGNGTTDDSETPTLAASGMAFERFSVNGNHACGVEADGDMYCWGRNIYGELGDGTRSQRSTTPTLVDGAHDFAEVAVGEDDTCGLTVDHQLWCWGRQLLGQDPLATPIENMPAPVVGAPPLVRVEAGESAFCGLTSGGVAWCWGRGFGSSPSPLPGGSGLVDLTVGRFHVCGVTGAGVGYCWNVTSGSARQEVPH